MAVKFFGQFLIEQGEVDAGHVREGLALLEHHNTTLGEVAVEAGFLTAKQAQDVHLAQRGCDKQWGDMAVELGFMTHEDLVGCIQRQRESRLRIGEALVQLGHLAEERLGPMLDAFKADQADYMVGALRQLPDPLANNRAAPYIIDLLPKFALRVAGVNIKVGAAQVLAESPPFPHRIGLPIFGHRGLEIILVGDNDFCRKIAAATAGVEEGGLDEDLLSDGVGEFLNVICGNAMSALDRDGVETRLGTPDYDAELADGWIFDLATSHGRAALILAQF